MSTTPRQVFISRVSREFGRIANDLRDTLQAVGEAGKTQVAFRQEPDAATTLAKLSEYIRDSDVVLCLLGEYSGAYPPDASLDEPIHPAPPGHGGPRTWRALLPVGFERLSYTQWELVLARFWKKPFLLYIGQGYAPEQPPPTADDDLPHQQEFIKWLTGTQGLDRNYFDTADRLEKYVLRDLWPRKLRRALGITAALAALIVTLIVILMVLNSQQVASLADLNQKLDEIKQEHADTGQQFSDLTREDIERLLAEKAEISVQELRRRIAAGTESRDPLERARALVLKGDFDTALKETAGLEKTRTDALIEVLNLQAQAYEGKSQYKEALAARQKIVPLTDKEKDPAAWADAQHMVAFSLLALHRDREAESILREVVAWRTAHLGSDNSDTLQSRNNLAGALGGLGKKADAEAEHRAVLAVRERVLGPEDPHTLNSRYNVAVMIAAQGRHTEAEAEHRAVLVLRKEVLGPEDPRTLESRNNIAIAIGVQGKNAEAEEEHRAVLALRKRVLSPEHPQTLDSWNNVAAELQEQGKYAEAEREHRALIAVRERVLRPDDPRTWLSRANLSNCLGRLGADRWTEGQKEQAREYWREGLELARKVEAAGARVFGAEQHYLAGFSRTVRAFEENLAR